MSNKNNWFKRQWNRWGDMFVSRIFLPYTIISFLVNLIRYFRQRYKIKKALLASQELVDELDENAFYLHEINFYIFKFRTYALDSIQLLTDGVQAMGNMNDETIKRLIVNNIKEMLKGRGKIIGDNTSLNIVQPQDKVLLIRLSPSWMRTVWVSSIDLLICLVVNIIAFLGWWFLF